MFSQKMKSNRSRFPFPESSTQIKVKICNSISHSDIRMREVNFLKIDDLISISDFLINGPQNQAQNEKLRLKSSFKKFHFKSHRRTSKKASIIFIAAGLCDFYLLAPLQ